MQETVDVLNREQFIDPAYLLRNSLVSPTLLAGIWNAKYVNAQPLYRQEQEFRPFCEDLLPWSDKLPEECQK